MANTQTREDLHIRLEETHLLDRDCTTLSRSRSDPNAKGCVGHG